MATVLITVTGSDRPGVTGVLFTALTSDGVQVLDVDQVVVAGALTLGVRIHTDGDPEAVQERTEQAMASVGMDVRVQIDPRTPPQPTASHALVLLGAPLSAKAIGGLARRFGQLGVNIQTIRGVADYPVTGLELTVFAPDEDALRAAVADVAADHGVDIAVQRAGLARRNKRLVVFDVDSTLITGEVIEMLAQRAGQAPEVADITRRAMRGELDFAEALRARVSLLAGLDASVLDEVGTALKLTPGARTTVRTLKRLGFRCGIVSGGFTQVTRHLVDELGLDFCAANTLQIAGGRLTGELDGTIIDRAGKATALAGFAARFGIPMEQTVAVGDGANDIDMLAAAGLGIAFNAKPVVAQHADTALNQPYLDTVLFVLGITREEVEAADAAEDDRGPAAACSADQEPASAAGKAAAAAGARAETPAR